MSPPCLCLLWCLAVTSRDAGAAVCCCAEWEETQHALLHPPLLLPASRHPRACCGGERVLVGWGRRGLWQCGCGSEESCEQGCVWGTGNLPVRETHTNLIT